MTPELIAAQLRQAIREKVFEPGASLVQEDLAQRFKVSRSPVREALRILASEGIVLMPSGGGATVRTLSLRDLMELYDLRILLEPQIADLVIQGALRRDIDRLTMMADQMNGTTSVQEWLGLNYEFHLFLYRLADRPHTQQVLENLLALVQPYSQENIEQLGGRTRADQEHRAMIAAIAENQPDELGRLFIEHLKAAQTTLAETYGTLKSADPLSSLR